jgi:hypothetical protein
LSLDNNSAASENVIVMPPDPDAELLHLTAVLTEPETLEGKPAQFGDVIVQAITERRPESARGWSVELPSPTRCVVHADIEAATQQTAAYLLLTDLERALFPQHIRPRNVVVTVQKIRVEVSYLP